MTNETDEVNKATKAFSTIVDYLRRRADLRNFTAPTFEIHPITKDFAKITSFPFFMLCQLNEQYYVIIYIPANLGSKSLNTFGVQNFRTLIAWTEKNLPRARIIVICAKQTTECKKIMDKYNMEYHCIELYFVNELQYNIFEACCRSSACDPTVETGRVLRLLPPAELVEMNKLPLASLPSILSTDAHVRYLNLQPGDVIEYNRSTSDSREAPRPGTNVGAPRPGTNVGAPRPADYSREAPRPADYSREAPRPADYVCKKYYRLVTNLNI
jgi:DNA-directed RNA polymerase subunit H (RpoH/RPB5)